jgi:hypothetical protein
MLRELSSKMVFGTSGVSANPRLEIEDPFWPLICPGAEFSSDIDRQHSVAYKAFSGQSQISNG